MTARRPRRRVPRRGASSSCPVRIKRQTTTAAIGRGGLFDFFGQNHSDGDHWNQDHWNNDWHRSSDWHD